MPPNWKALHAQTAANHKYEKAGRVPYVMMLEYLKRRLPERARNSVVALERCQKTGNFFLRFNDGREFDTGEHVGMRLESDACIARICLECP